MAVIAKILVIFIMIGLGFTLGKVGLLPEESNIYISRLVVFVGSPTLLFSAILERELSAETIRITVEMLVGAICFFVVGSLMAYLICRLLKVNDSPDSGIYMLLMTTLNSSFMGFPLMETAFGSTGLYLMVFGNIVHNIFLYSFGILFIEKGSGKGKSLWYRIRPVINPCTIAAVLGVIIIVLGIELPDIVVSPIKYMAGMTIPLSMISVGLSICASNVKSILGNRKLIGTCLIKNLIWPAVMMTIVMFTNFSPMVKCVLALMGALPPSVSGGALVRQRGKNATLASEGIVFSTIISILTIPVMYLILTNVMNV